MAKAVSQRLFALYLILVVLAVSARGQDYKPLLGTWSMTSETPGDPVKWTLALKESDGKLIATLNPGEGEKTAKDLTFTDGVLKFRAPYQDSYYDIEVRHIEGKLEGTWDGDGDSGRTHGTKN